MKILFIVSSLACGGAERIVQILLNKVKKDHREIILISFEDKITFPIPDGLRIILLRKRGRWDFFRIVFKIWGYLKEEKPEVIISFLHYTNLIAIIAKFLARVRNLLIITEHSILKENLKLKENWVSVLKRFLIKKLYVKADYIVCVSNSVRNDLIKNFSIPDSEKLITIYNGLDISQIVHLSKKETFNSNFDNRRRPFILSVGRLCKEKQLEDLLCAFKIVKNKVGGSLIIIGEGQEYGNILKITKRLSISEDVEMIGFQKNPFSYMARSDVFVMTSSSESFGNVIIEAMACGLPVISTACGGPNEIIKNRVNGLLVPVNDIKAIAEAILITLTDHELRKRMIDRGRECAEEYDCNKMLSLYESLFESTQRVI